MSKYDPLYKWLRAKSASKGTRIPATLEQIEEILGADLPDTARIKPQWWGNEKTDSPHTQCKAWLNAGFEVRELNIHKETVKFEKV
jgi:hypothetical protein